MNVIEKPSAAGMRGARVVLRYGIHPFATGHILIALSSEGLCWLGLDCPPARLARDWPRAELIEDKKITAAAAREISKLWPKNLDEMKTPVVLYGTPFQIAVWRALLKIKAGSVVTYGDIARRIKKPLAVRAVGTAVGRNPVSVVVPCHRVVNKNSSTVNYGWGAPLKKALLKGEGVSL